MSLLIPEIKIDHLSWRVYDRCWDRGEENKYIVYNIVFSIVEGVEGACYSKSYPLSLTKEYISVCAHLAEPNPLDILEDYEKYKADQVKAWISNPTQTLHYIEKFDKFQAREWVEYNPVTLACLEGLKKLKDNQDSEFKKDWQGMTAHVGKFYRLLYTLDTWWD